MFIVFFIALLEMNSVKKFRNSLGTDYGNANSVLIVLDEAGLGMIFGDFTAMIF